MGTTVQHFNLVRVSKSSWVAVHANHSGDGNVYSPQTESTVLRSNGSPSGRIFSQMAAERTSFTERFPRLTIAMIAFALLAISATAEVEMLLRAGYIWR
ncbi:MAG: hypothetical protein WBF42_14370 [Terracidiphilus sp.]